MVALYAYAEDCKMCTSSDLKHVLRANPEIHNHLCVFCLLAVTFLTDLSQIILLKLSFRQ